MAHFFFVFFHIIAIILGFWMLLFSIPLHIFYVMNKSNAKKISKDIKEQTEILKQQQVAHDAQEEMKKCEFCAEYIKLEAKICRYCGNETSLITANNEKNAQSDATKVPSVESSSNSKFLKSLNVSKAEVEAIARLEADGFTVKKYAIGTTSVYWKCVNDSLVFKARTVDELILYSEQ